MNLPEFLSQWSMAVNITLIVVVAVGEPIHEDCQFSELLDLISWNFFEALLFVDGLLQFSKLFALVTPGNNLVGGLRLLLFRHIN